MGIKMNIKNAAARVGISEWSLRLGIKQGRYSFLKFGNGRGRIFIDIDVLEKELETEAEQNKQRQAEIYSECQRQQLKPAVTYIGALSRKAN